MNFARSFRVTDIQMKTAVNPLNVEIEDRLTKNDDSSSVIRITLPREDAVLLLTEKDLGHFMGSHNGYYLDVTFPLSLPSRMVIAINDSPGVEGGPIEQVGTVTAVDG